MNKKSVVTTSLMSAMSIIGCGMNLTGSMGKTKGKHWKETQSNSERQDKLERARLKRERKALKRQNEQR